MGGCRASRVRRPATPPRIRLTERDLDLFEDLVRVRFLTAVLIEWLHFPPREGKRAGGFSSACRTRLRLLWQAGYLDRLWPDRFNGPAVYTLDRKGREALAACRGFPSDGPVGRGQRGLSLLFLEHALGVARVYAAVAAALRRVEGVRLAAFQGEQAFQGPGEHDRFPDPTDPRRTLPVVPDGLFVLERADGRRRLMFVEVDRGTMEERRVRGKVQGYGGYQVGEGPVRFRARFGHPPVFGVAWVGKDRQGKERLQRLVGEEWAQWAGSGEFVVHLFHTLPDLTPATALVWEDAAGREVSLLGRG